MWILDYRHHLSIILLFCTCNIAHEKSSSGVRPISLVLELVHMQSKSIQYNSKKSQFNVNFRLPGSSVHNSSVLHVQYTTWKVIISGETHFFNSRTCPHEIQEHPIQLKKKKTQHDVNFRLPASLVHIFSRMTLTSPSQLTTNGYKDQILLLWIGWSRGQRHIVNRTEQHPT